MLTSSEWIREAQGLFVSFYMGRIRSTDAGIGQSANNDSPICGDRMDLKNVLGQIKADGGNLHGRWLLMLVFA
jgi:hypothetical protein